MASRKLDHYSAQNKFKVVFLGDIEVGKTAIINHFIHGKFNQTHAPTIGIDFLSKTMVIDERVVRFQIWDTAGQEKFHALIPTYIKDASAAIITFDLTKYSTFEHVARWHNDFRDQLEQGVVVVVVGNKSDLNEKREVSTHEGEAAAARLNAIYLETSAKEGTNVKEIFQRIAQELPEESSPEPDSIMITPENNAPNANTNARCC